MLADRFQIHMATKPTHKLKYKFISDRDGSMVSAQAINFELHICGFESQTLMNTALLGQFFEIKACINVSFIHSFLPTFRKLMSNCI